MAHIERCTLLGRPPFRLRIVTAWCETCNLDVILIFLQLFKLAVPVHRWLTAEFTFVPAHVSQKLVQSAFCPSTTALVGEREVQQ